MVGTILPPHLPSGMRLSCGTISSWERLLAPVSLMLPPPPQAARRLPAKPRLPRGRMAPFPLPRPQHPMIPLRRRLCPLPRPLFTRRMARRPVASLPTRKWRSHPRGAGLHASPWRRSQGPSLGRRRGSPLLPLVTHLPADQRTPGLLIRTWPSRALVAGAHPWWQLQRLMSSLSRRHCPPLRPSLTLLCPG